MARSRTKRFIHFLRFPLEAAVAYSLMAAFCLMPRRWTHWIGWAAGKAGFEFSGRSRRVALENLQLMLGVDEREARRIALASCGQAGASFSDLIRAPRMTKRLARKFLEVPEETWQKIDAIRKGGRGAVMACGHLGNWELLNLTSPFCGIPPMTVVVRPILNPLLNTTLDYARSRTGQRMIHRTGAAQECMQWVREGGTCGITFDLPVPAEAGADAVDFFGRKTYTTLGVGYVAAMARAPIYLAYCLHTGRGRYRLVLEGPIEVPDCATLKQSALEATRLVSRKLEEVIRAHPEAWGWWLKRWRIRPDGAAKEDYPSYSVEASNYLGTGEKPRRDYAMK
jgi:KDO2-lipid IV(A) lauroyltransferase